MAGAKRKPQKFCVSVAKKSKFRSGGLRAMFRYRDLGIAKATHGRFHAHVIRAARACRDGTGRHYHTLDFQMVYVLKGWVKFIYAGQGTFTFRAGDSVLQPPGIRHELVACSKNLEMLEITAPADFATVEA